MTSLRIPRRVALVSITALVVAASVASFSESYRALYLWAQHHGLNGPWCPIWPLQVDTFIAVGELALFVALADGWSVRSRTAAWSVTLLGLAASVAGNVGHVAGHDLASRATAAVPPMAAAAALAVGLGVLKRVVARTVQTGAETTSVPVTDTAAVAAVIPDTQPDMARTPGRTPKPAKQAAKAAAIVRRQADGAGAGLGKRLGVSERQGRRILAPISAGGV